MAITQGVEDKSNTGRAADIFVSYAREDIREAEKIVKALEAQGWSVWFDGRISAGANWDKAVEAALESARCVIVIWSNASVESDWVRAEAESARERGIALPVRITDIQLPVVFRTIQTPSLLGWSGNISHPGFVELIRGITALLEKPRLSGHLVPHQNQLQHRLSWLMIGFIVLPITAILVLNLTKVREIMINVDVRVSQFDVTLDADRQIFDPIVLREIGISGIQEILFPREKAVAGHQRTAHTVQSDKITLKSSTLSQQESSITLEPIFAKSGTHLQFQHRSNPNELGVSLYGLPEPIRVNVMGYVTVQYPPKIHYTSDFGSPKPVVLSSDGRSVDFVLTYLATPSSWLSNPLPISQLTFVRVDERITLRTSSILEVSTIISGIIRIGTLEDLTITLRPQDLIRLGTVKGSITALNQEDNGIRLQFVGDTTRLEKCVGTACQSEMPTRWVWLRKRHPLLLYGTVAIYILCLIILFINSWRKSPD